MPRVKRSWLVLALLGLLPASIGADRPATGRADETFAPLDALVTGHMDKIDASAATLAVSRAGVLLYSRGFGTIGPERDQPTPPDAQFRIASVSKPLTAAAVRKLIEDDRLNAETHAFELLNLRPARLDEAKPDPRLDQITITHLLEHKAGWDRDATFDPVFRLDQIRDQMNLRRPPTATDVVRYMMARPLDTEPGETEAYSNVGYVVLGRIIERAGRQPYERYVTRQILRPIGCDAIVPGRSDRAGRRPNEVRYPPEAYDVRLEPMDAAAGWVASAPDLCRFMTHYWLNGQPRRPTQWGNWHFFGSLPGTTAYVEQREDGYDLAVLFNNRRQDHDEQDNDALREAINEALDAIAATHDPALP
ncbi:MAG: serine hydrolase [Planctomycetes bacterium]|jgi:N-acyl-D-amino-acid deacylase|nr:serine hydrolase [Planctomycetota bacterium]